MTDAPNPFAKYSQPRGDNPFSKYAQQPAPEPAASVRPKRTLTEAFTDTGRALASGVGTVVEGVGTLGGLATGNMDNSVTQLGQSVQDYWREGQSDQLKYDREQRSAAIDRADGVLGKAGTAIKETVTNPGLLVDTVAETAASMLPAGAVGRAGAVVAGTRALRQGATAAQAARRATRVGTAAGIGTGAVQAGADVAGGTYDGAMARDDAAWERNPEFINRVAAGEAPEAVKRDLSLTASRVAFAGTLPLSIASQAIPGGATVERAIAGAASRAGSQSGLLSRGLNAVRGAAGEGLQESIEEGGGQFLGNLAQREYVDPQADLADGVGEAAGLGFVGGAGLGGIAGGVQRPRTLSEKEEAGVPPNAPQDAPRDNAIAPELLALPAPDRGTVNVDAEGVATTEPQRYEAERRAEQGARQRAEAGLTPDVERAASAHPGFARTLPDGSPAPNPNAGPLSRAANVGLDNGAVDQAAADAAAQAAVVEQEQADKQGQSRGRRESPAPAETPPLNMDPATGELIPYTPDQMRAYVHDVLNRGNQPRVKPLAQGFGVDEEAMRSLILEVRAERRAAALAPRDEASDGTATRRPDAGRNHDVEGDAVGTGGISSASVVGDDLSAGEPAGAAPTDIDAQATDGAPADQVTDPVPVQGDLLGSATEPPAAAPEQGAREPAAAPADEGAPASAVSRGEAVPPQTSVEPSVPDPSPLEQGATPDGADGISKLPAATSEPSDAPQGAASELPAGWTEAAPGGLITNPDPERGGIVDRQIADGTWFAVPNRDGAAPLEGFETREQALAALGPAPGGQDRAPSSPVEAAAADAATHPGNGFPEPTDAQKKAGNYKKGHARVGGLDVSIENPAGSRRRPEWPPLANHYGYFKGTVGADKDHVDVFLTDRAEDTSLPVFVVDQINRDGSFDEHKVVMGAATKAEARAAYLSNYEQGWTGLGAITQMGQDEFTAWVRDPKKTARPAAAPASAPVAEPARDTYGLARIVRTKDAVAALRREAKLTVAQAEAVFDAIDRAGLKEGTRARAAVVAAIEHAKANPPPKKAAAKKAKKAPGRRTVAAEGSSTPAAPTAPRRMVDEAPNGIRVGDRVVVNQDRNEGSGRSTESYEATVRAIEINAPPAYAGTAFKVATDDATADGRGTGWVGIDRVSAAPGPDAPSPSSAIPTAEQAVAGVLRRVAGEVEQQGTRGGTRPLDAKWAEGAIKRGVDARGVLAGKQVGKLASAKIAVAKARTPADLRAAADKLDPPDVPQATVSAPSTEAPPGAASDPGAAPEAQQSVQRPAPAKPRQSAKAKVEADRAAPARTSEPKTATSDAGEELWYNRRNRSGAGLQWADVDGLNDTLKVKEVVKSKVWPRPDYEQLVADGLRPEFAHLVKQVYDTVATKPRVRGTPTDEQMQAYIDTVGKVREAVFEFVRDNARVGGALNQVLGSSSTNGGTLRVDLFARPDESMLNAVFPGPEGGGSRWRANDNNANANLIGGNKVARALQISRSNFADAVKAVAEGWPAPQAAWQRMYKIRQYSAGFAVTRAGRTVARELPTREAAEAAAKDHYEQSRQTGGEMAAEARAVEDAKRTGPQHRRPDEDVTSERFLETFGFRGVNFGNWMKGDAKAKVRERQLHLNHAYDALMDLAELTGLPPRAMSLEGRLGIAFGAQGSGGRGAAHFVPGVNEINLTRRTGAGGLAHEWAHALDHYFAVQAGEQVARSSDPYLTQFSQTKRVGLEVRPEIARAFRKIVNAAQSRPLTEEEVSARAEQQRRYLAGRVDNALTPLRKLVTDTANHREGTDAEQAVAEFDALAERLRAGDRGEGRIATGRKVKGLRPRTRVDEEVSQTAGQMLGLLRDSMASSNDEFILRYLTDADAAAGVLAYHEEQAAQRENHVPQSGEVRSNYLKEAIALESKSAKQGSGRRYWSTPWELFARAFESYVIDRLSSDQRRNDYLSWPQMSEQAAQSMKEAGLLKGDQYPRGAERARINEGFDELLAEIRSEETAEGQVRLFSQPDRPADQGMTAEQVTRVISRVTARWGEGAPRVVVVENAAGLPQHAKADPAHATAEGFYDSGEVYLVAANLRSASRALQVLAHEVVGHHGIEAITGEAMWADLGRTVERMRGSERYADLFAQIDRRYPNADPGLKLRETIAVMAERGIRNSVVDRAIEAVRQFLRRLGFAMQISPAELRQHLVRAARHLDRPGRAAAADSEGGRFSAHERPLSEFMRGAPVATTEGTRFRMSDGNLTKTVLAYFREIHDGRAFNPQVGEVLLTRVGIKSSVAHGLGEAKAAAFELVPHVVRDGRLIDEAVHYQGKRHDRLTIGAPVNIGGVGYLMGVMLRRDVNGARFYLHEVELTPQQEPPQSVLTGAAISGGGTSRHTGVVPNLLRDAYEGKLDGRFSVADPIESSAFRRWFGQSKVVTGSGVPKVVYHGTSEGFWAFDKERLASSTGHMSAPLGFFFAEDRAKAQRYAENAADGVPADERVVDAYLSIQNPRTMTTEELLAIDSQDEARALRARLQRQGVDGIHLTDIGQWIAFEPSQVKSASQNRGTFDPGSDDIRFSRPDPAAAIDAMDAGGRTPKEVTDRLKSMFRGMKPENLRENTRPAWLGALTLRHLAELAGDIKLRQVGHYADRVQRMATDRNVMQEEAGKVSDAWERFQRKDRVGADATANLMHDSTIEGVDPSIDYAPMRTGVTKRGPDEAVTAESIARRKEMIAKDLRNAGTQQARERLHAEAARLDELLASERRRQAAYPRLVQRFSALPDAGRELYVSARDAYTRQSDRMLDALVQRIEALEMDGRDKAKMISQVREQFESARLAGPYFPLQRFGDYWINAEDAKGEPAFLMYERVQDWREAQRELKAQGYTIKNAGRKLDEARSLAGASGGFVADLQALLETAGVDSDTRDEVYQLYLRTLPELSIRKHSIHRKATAGYSGDALRAFSANMFHGSFQIARLRHTHELEADLLMMKKAVNDLTADDPERAAKAAALYTEVNKRHEWVMNPRDSKVASSLTSLGFAWYLGTTPAAAVVNLTQTAIVSYPVLAARFGPGKAFTALSEGMGRAMRNVDGNLVRGLSDEERAAFKVWYESGAIDRSQAHNLAGLSETDTRAFNPVARRTMEVVSFLFHRAEVVNREATALAAFRLARQAGQSFSEATKYAEEVVIESHFDYSNANRARFMQSNAAKVLLLFRQYSLNMTWFLWRNAYQTFKGESPEVRREARGKLAGVLGMTGIFAGALGMPLTSIMFGIANAAAAAFGDDDDDPWDAEVAFRNFLADTFGDDLARVIARGPVDYLTGASVSSRVSLNDLWFREPNRELEGQAQAHYLLEQAAGPLFGGMLVNTLRGLQQVEEGHTWRGVETMMPKAVKDGMKSLRYATDGVNTLRGDPVIEDLSVGQALLQLAGFSPARLNDRYDGINAAKEFEQRLLDRRSTLLNAYAMAWRAGDADTTRKVLEKIRAFNAAQPELAISTSTVRQSLQARMRYSSRAEGGVVLSPRLAHRAREQARFAD